MEYKKGRPSGRPFFSEPGAVRSDRGGNTVTSIGISPGAGKGAAGSVSGSYTHVTPVIVREPKRYVMDNEFWSRVSYGATRMFAALGVVAGYVRVEYDRFYLGTAKRFVDHASGEINPVTIKGITLFLDDKNYHFYKMILPVSLVLFAMSIISALLRKRLERKSSPNGFDR